MLKTLLVYAAVTGGARASRHGEHTSLAVVMPITADYVERVRVNFEFWKHNVPCTTIDRRVNATFVFQINTRFTPQLKSTLADIWQATTAGTRCFAGGVLFEEAALTPEEDQPRVLGTCWQHYRTFPRMMELGFDHWLQFEADVIPVRPRWLSRVADEAAPNQGCERFWIRGPAPAYGPPRVTTSARIDGHILNGNALYCLNGDVLEYARRIVAEYPPNGCTVSGFKSRDGLKGLVGFDWVSYLYRTSAAARGFLTAREHLVQVASWITDYGCCTTAASVRAAVEQRKDLHLVHTKVFF